MKRLGICQFSSTLILWMTLGNGSPSRAQIIPDASLPNNAVINREGQLHRITEGTTINNNLFHSFREFSLKAGNRALFDNATSINNIFSRVTGGKISNIDGIIEANGKANLFFINPNGIVFGPNARLNIGGSFIASTAESVIFDNGSFFSASNPNVPPLLTVNVPIGLQLGGNPGAIEVRGDGHNLQIEDPIFQPIVRGDNVGLEVRPQQTIGLVGGEITIDSGIINAPGGRIELGSVSDSRVNLAPTPNGWSLSYDPAAQFQNIRFANQALADASGEGGGEIAIQARNLEILDGSALLIQNSGNSPAGNIDVKTTESVELRGNTPDGRVFSTFYNQTISPGEGGDLNVKTGRLVLRDGARIMAQSMSEGAGGNVTVTATDSVEAMGFLPANPSRTTVIGAYVLGDGDGGDITLTTGRLGIFDGGTIAAITWRGAGNGGNVTVNATDIELDGIEPRTFSSSLLGAESFSIGRAGNLSVNTSVLKVSNGGRVFASSFASGDAGNLEINASEFIEVSGTNPGSGEPSLISSAALVPSQRFREEFGLPAVPSADSGKITINTPTLRIFNRGLVGVRNDGTGDSGTLEVNADTIALSNNGGLTAIATYGRGGNINLQTRELRVANGVINASTLGEGKGGNININASGSVEVIGPGLEILEESTAASIGGALALPDVNSGIISGTSGSGAAGNITIETPRLTLSNGGVISTASSGIGAAGNLVLNATNEIEVSQSFVSVSSLRSGNGGDLNIDTRRLVVRDGGRLLARAYSSGNAGTITVRATDAVEAIGLNVNGQPATGLFTSVEEGATGAGGNLTVETGRLLVTGGAQISANTFGVGDAGSLMIRASEEIDVRGTDADESDFAGIYTVVGDNATGNGGSLLVETGRLRVSRGGEVGAGTFGAGDAGTLTIRASESVEVNGTDPDGFPTALFVDTIGSGTGGNLVIETRRLTVKDGAQVSAGTFDVGEGGSVVVKASELVELSGSTPEIPDEDYFRDLSGTLFPSGLFASSPGINDAGTLNIDTDRLVLSNGAQVSVSSQNAGAAGNINISARDVRLDNGFLSAETIEGDRGNILVNARNIQLRNGSGILTNATGPATGGNITINTQTLTALENSDISANAVQSFGGQVNVNIVGIFGTEFRAKNTHLSDITATSALGATFSGQVQITTPDIDPGEAIVRFSDNAVDVTQLLANNLCSQEAKQSSFVVTGKGGLPPNPIQTLTNSRPMVSWAAPIEEGRSLSSQQPHSSITVTPTQPPLVEATGWIVTLQGKIQLVADAPTLTPATPAFIPSNCP